MNDTLSRLRTDWRNYLITALGGALVSMVGLYFSGVQNHITQKEAEKIVDSRLELLNQKLEQFNGLPGDIKTIQKSVHQIELDLSVMRTRLNERKLHRQRERWDELQFQTKPGPDGEQ